MPPEGIRVRHVISDIGPASYGLGPVALNLVREQRALGMDAGIWCLNSPDEVEAAADKVGLAPEAITAFGSRGPAILRYSPDMERAAAGSDGRSIDVLHQHGIWTGLSRVTNRWRQQTGRPTLIAPHGSLEAWARRRSVWRKRAALAAYESANLANASCMHATSILEADGIREAGCVNPIALVPNGISSKWLDSRGDAAGFRSRFGIGADRRLLLYIGRITPVKNLPMFVEAMARVGGALGPWLLVVIGRDEFGHKAELDATIARLGMSDRVHFAGSVSEQDKRDAFEAAEVVVLPSVREASPIVVLEALGAARPVLTTQGVPWDDVETADCGWRPAVDAAAMAQALARIVQTPAAQLRLAGQRARQLAETQYQWSHAARRSADVYEWLMGRAAMPPCVLEAATATPVGAAARSL